MLEPQAAKLCLLSAIVQPLRTNSVLRSTHTLLTALEVAYLKSPGTTSCSLEAPPTDAELEDALSAWPEVLMMLPLMLRTCVGTGEAPQ